MAVEKETKLIIENEEEFDRILTTGMPEEYQISERGIFTRRFLYYDTENLTLSKMGITLAARQREDDIVLSCKVPVNFVYDVTRNTYTERNESEARLQGTHKLALGEKMPDCEEARLQTEVISFLIGKLNLRAVLEMRYTNHRKAIYRDNRHVLELSLTKFEGTMDGKKSQAIYEAEVEIQKAGRVEFLDQISRFLASKYNLERTHLNKYQRMLGALGR